METKNRRKWFIVIFTLSALTLVSYIFDWQIALQQQSLIGTTIGSFALRLPIVFGVGTMAVALVARNKLQS